MMEVCDRCNKIIQDGEIRYSIRISVSADDGGEIASLISTEEIDSLLKGLSNVDPFELARQVFEEREHIICSACKKSYMKNPLGKHPFDPPEKDDTHSLH